MIHLITGNTGAGKSTYAKKLAEKYGAIIFSIDDWNNTLFLMDKKPSDGIEWMLERISRAEVMIWRLCLQMDMQSQDVVLDLGFSKIEHREKFRKLAKSQEIDFKLHFLDYSKDVRLNRILSRNNLKGETYVFDVDKEMFSFMESWFERPSNKELKGATIIDIDTESKDIEPDYFKSFSQHHLMELRFCMRLTTGMDNGVSLAILRSFVLDFWESILSKHLSLEDELFINLDKNNSKVIQFLEEQMEIKSMVNAISTSESVSNSYLLKLTDLLKRHVRFEERSFYPYLLDSYDDISLKTIRKNLANQNYSEHKFKPIFWED